MTLVRRFLTDEGHVPARPVPTSFTAMLTIAGSLIVIAIVVGCIIGRGGVV